MGDHTGGAGRGRVGRGTIPVTYQTAVEGRQSTRILSADNALRLRFAGELNDARNPGRQRVLVTQPGIYGGRNRAVEARHFVRAFRDSYNGRDGAMTRARLTSNAAVRGASAGFRERSRQFDMTTRG